MQFSDHYSTSCANTHDLQGATNEAAGGVANCTTSNNLSHKKGVNDGTVTGVTSLNVTNPTENNSNNTSSSMNEQPRFNWPVPPVPVSTNSATSRTSFLALLLKQHDEVGRKLVPDAAPKSSSKLANDIQEPLRMLAESASSLHMQLTARMRAELSELTHRFQSNREWSLRETQRLQCELDQSHCNLANQTGHYEGRMAELHTLIARLQQRSRRPTGDGDVDTRGIDCESQGGGTSIGPMGEDNEDDFDVDQLMITDDRLLLGRRRIERLSDTRTYKEDCIVRLLPSEVNANQMTADVANVSSLSSNYDKVVDQLRSQLLAVTEERDQLAKRLNDDDESQRADVTSPQDSHLDDRSGLSNLQLASVNSLAPVMHSNPITTPPPVTNSSVTNNKSEEEVYYALAEPSWLTSLLDQYEAAIAEQSQSTTNDQYDIVLSDSNDPLTTGSLAQLEAFLTLLSDRLATPYPRLSDLGRHLLLTLNQLTARLARSRADCLQLAASLTEAKSTGDALQLRLFRAESSLAGWRSVGHLGDSMLELSHCLNQLYASELALHLGVHCHHRRHHHHRVSAKSRLPCQQLTTPSQQYRPTYSINNHHRPSSTLSSSTSSSSMTGRPLPTPSVDAASPHPYAIYANPDQIVTNGGVGNNSWTDVAAVANNSLLNGSKSIGKHLIKQLRYQAELQGHVILDKHESSSPTFNDLLASYTIPLAESNSNINIPPNANPINSPNWNLRPPTKTLLTNNQSTAMSSINSIYANSSWYVSLNRLNNTTAVATAQSNVGINPLPAYLPSGSLPLSQSGRKPSLAYRRAVVGQRLFVGPHQQEQSATLPTTSSQPPRSSSSTSGTGGCQTPDSGAGSSSCTTNNNLNQNNDKLVYQLYDQPHYGPFPTVPHPTVLHCHELLEQLPTVKYRLPTATDNDLNRQRRRRLHQLLNENDSESSSDSDSSSCSTSPSDSDSSVERDQPTSAVRAQWSRENEKRLWSLLGHLGQLRYQLLVDCLSSSSDQTSLNSSSGDSRGGVCEDDQVINNYQQRQTGSSNTNLSIGRCSDASVPSFDASSKLQMLLVLDSAVLLQELSTVKEERADFKARLYLLEKDLHSTRLALESRTAAERALRVHLDALSLTTVQRDPPSQAGSSSTASSSGNSSSELAPSNIRSPLPGSSETTLLQEQVKNLLSALEALRQSSEMRQSQSDALLDDLRRANSALIVAFEKAKRKYLTRIGKLEHELSANCQPRSSAPVPTNQQHPRSSMSPRHLPKSPNRHRQPPVFTSTKPVLY